MQKEPVEGEHRHLSRTFQRSTSQQILNGLPSYLEMGTVVTDRKTSSTLSEGLFNIAIVFPQGLYLIIITLEPSLKNAYLCIWPSQRFSLITVWFLMALLVKWLISCGSQTPGCGCGAPSDPRTPPKPSLQLQGSPLPSALTLSNSCPTMSLTPENQIRHQHQNVLASHQLDLEALPWGFGLLLWIAEIKKVNELLRKRCKIYQETLLDL